MTGTSVDSPIAMTTLGCPEWSLAEICDACNQYGYDGVDFRGYLDEPRDVTQHPAFVEDPAAVAEQLADAGVQVSGLSSSIQLCADVADQPDLDQAQRFIDLADALDVEYVRVYGAGNLEARSRGDLIDIGRRSMTGILDLPGARSVTWLLETHDNWIDSRQCEALLDAIDDPNVGLMWDAGHTTRVGDESPAETLDRVGEWIEYVHLKDAVQEPSHPDAMDDGWRYVHPGTGELPLADAVHELRARGYDGWIMFEHEKRWQPALSPPEQAYPAFVEWYRSLEPT